MFQWYNKTADLFRVNAHIITPAILSTVDTNTVLLSERPNDRSSAGFKNWTFMSVHNWGESPSGSWQLKIKDRVRRVWLKTKEVQPIHMDDIRFITIYGCNSPCVGDICHVSVINIMFLWYMPCFCDICHVSVIYAMFWWCMPCFNDICHVSVIHAMFRWYMPCFNGICYVSVIDITFLWYTPCFGDVCSVSVIFAMFQWYMTCFGDQYMHGFCDICNFVVIYETARWYLQLLC